MHWAQPSVFLKGGRGHVFQRLGRQERKLPRRTTWLYLQARYKSVTTGEVVRSNPDVLVKRKRVRA